MPYADPAVQAEFNRNLYLTRYQSDAEFREAEAFRKKLWYARNQAKITARYRGKRKKLRAELRKLRKQITRRVLNPAPISEIDELF